MLCLHSAGGGQKDCKTYVMYSTLSQLFPTKNKMSEAEIASERPERTRKTIFGSALIVSHSQNLESLKNLSTVLNQEKRFSDRIGCLSGLWIQLVMWPQSFPRGAFCRGCCLHRQG